MQKSIILAAVLSSAIGACAPIDAGMETIPVDVESDQGKVTCQLYNHDIVMWDRAIAFPQGMTAEAAREVCLDEGLRRIPR